MVVWASNPVPTLRARPDTWLPGFATCQQLTELRHAQPLTRWAPPVARARRHCCDAQKRPQQSGAAQLASKALEQAVNSITKILSDHERKQNQRRLEGGGQGVAAGAEATVVEGRQVGCSASASGERVVQELRNTSAGRALGDYLALPATQYSVLDPRWITRDAERADTFVLRVPLADLTGVPWKPQVTIRVTVDADNDRVRFAATDFLLGEPAFDQDFEMVLDASLSHKPVPVMRAFIRNLGSRWRGAGGSEAGGPSAPAAGSTVAVTTATSDGADDGAVAAAASAAPSTFAATTTEVAEAAATSPAAAAATSTPSVSAAADAAPPPLALPPASATPSSSSSSSSTSSSSSSEPATYEYSYASFDEGGSGGGGGDKEAPQRLLCANVKIDAHMRMPYPLSVVPGPLLSLTANLVAKLALQALLPKFLDLLAEDYLRWASSPSERDTRAAVGSLLPDAAAARTGGNEQGGVSAEATAEMRAVLEQTVVAGGGTVAAVTAAPTLTADGGDASGDDSSGGEHAAAGYSSVS